MTADDVRQWALLAATVALAFFTVRLWSATRRMAEATGNAAVKAGEAAEAAKASVELAAASLEFEVTRWRHELEERERVHALDVDVVLAPGPPGFATVTCFNRGRHSIWGLDFHLNDHGSRASMPVDDVIEPASSRSANLQTLTTLDSWDNREACVIFTDTDGRRWARAAIAGWLKRFDGNPATLFEPPAIEGSTNGG